MSLPDEQFPKAVEDFLATSRMSPSRLGMDALGDPNFVADLRNGREPRRAIREKVLAFMEGASTQAGGSASAPEPAQ